MRATLARAGWPVDDEALPLVVMVHTAIRRQLQAVLDADLGAVPPETDLDPSRPPSELV